MDGKDLTRRHNLALQFATRLLSLLKSDYTENDISKLLALLSSQANEKNAEQSPLAFCPTEFSLSLSNYGSMPAIRCLAESIDLLKTSPLCIEETYHIGQKLIDQLAFSLGEQQCPSVFRDIYQVVYQPIEDIDATGSLHRFGSAIEWRPGKLPSAKCYFDLYSGGKKHSLKKLENIFSLLGLLDSWHWLQNDPFLKGQLPLCRGIGMDFSEPFISNLRLYLPGSSFNLNSILNYISPDQINNIHIFNKLVLNQLPACKPLQNLLVSIIFASVLPFDRPIIKLDVWMPAFKADDYAAISAIVQLMNNYNISDGYYKDVQAIMSENRKPRSTRRIHQFLSVDMIDQEKIKLNLYFRPFNLQPRHLHSSRCPEIKTSNLEQLDEIIRSTINTLEQHRISNFDGAIHRMNFPWSYGFTGKTEIQEGRIYLLTVISDALLTAAVEGFDIDWFGIDSDIEQICNLQSSEYPYAWSYFPNLPELPPRCR